MMANAVTFQSRRRELVYMAIACLPLVVVVVAIVGGFGREWVAAFENRQTIAALVAAVEPINQAEVTAARNVGKTMDGLAEWIEINQASAYLNDRFSDVLQEFHSVRDLVPPGQSLDSEAILKQHSEMAQPIIAQFEETGVYRGISSRYTSNFAVDSVLAREFFYAYHLGNSNRALELLKLGQLDQTKTILKSLEYDFWDFDELAELRSMVAVSSNYDQAWESMVTAGRADFLEAVDSDYHGGRYRRDTLADWFGFAPTHVRAGLSTLGSAEELRGLGTRQGYEAAKNVENSEEVFSLVSVPMATGELGAFRKLPSFKSAANHNGINLITNRRVITAIAIKQFKLQEGRWPKSLDELTKVGLTSSDWKIVGNQDFGYQVSEDGKSVLLWSAGSDGYLDAAMWHEKNFQTPPQPPSSTVMSTSYVEANQSVIR